MSHASRSHDGQSLAGVRVALVGRLGGMSRRDACRLIREHGGIALDRVDSTIGLLVVGDESSASNATSARHFALRKASLDEAARSALRRGEMEVISETELWRRLGLGDDQHDIQRLYTLSMLASLLNVDVAVVRKWQRRGWIGPVRTIRRLAYFDFEQVLIARRLAGFFASGASPAALERQLAEWRQHPDDSPLALPNFAVVVGGRYLLQRRGDALFGADGQHWLSFVGETGEESERAQSNCPDVADYSRNILLLADAQQTVAPTPETLVQMAEELEDQQELVAAADMYRAAAAAGGLSADLCFSLAELFYRMGDLAAARERYFMAIELDENFVEARANLGCLLAEQGRLDLAVAAFEGALRYHADYADAHYHLARTLSDLGRRDEAMPHWEAFLRLAPDSPWAAEVRLLVAISESTT